MPSGVAAMALATLRRAGPAGARALYTSPDAQEALKFAVVGSGPAGFYTADKVCPARRRRSSPFIPHRPHTFPSCSCSKGLLTLKSTSW